MRVLKALDGGESNEEGETEGEHGIKICPRWKLLDLPMLCNNVKNMAPQMDGNGIGNRKGDIDGGGKDGIEE